MKVAAHGLRLPERGALAIIASGSPPPARTVAPWPPNHTRRRAAKHRLRRANDPAVGWPL